MAEVFVVRHGATEWSVEGRHTGHTDLALLPQGEDQARALAPRLAGVEFDLVLTSPLQRARRTAELAGFGDAIVDPDLVEWDYGDLEGMTTEQIRQRWPNWSVWTGPWPGGDDPTTVAERLVRVRDRVRARSGPVLIFAHGHVLRAFAGEWLRLGVVGGQHLRLDTGTISVLGWERERPVILRWNC